MTLVLALNNYRSVRFHWTKLYNQTTHLTNLTKHTEPTNLISATSWFQFPISDSTIYSFFIYMHSNCIHLTFHTIDIRDSRDYVYCIIIINYIISIVPIQLNSCHINKVILSSCLNLSYRFHVPFHWFQRSQKAFQFLWPSPHPAVKMLLNSMLKKCHLYLIEEYDTSIMRHGQPTMDVNHTSLTCGHPIACEHSTTWSPIKCDYPIPYTMWSPYHVW